MAQGTPLAPLYFRLLGCRIGAGVHMESTWLTEYDLVKIGDGVCLGPDCTLQTHLFEDRVMKMSTVELGAGCSVGTDAVVLYGTRMEPGSRLGDLSLLMKGETLPAGTPLAGQPRAEDPVRPAFACVAAHTEASALPGLSEALGLAAPAFFSGHDPHGRPRAQSGGVPVPVSLSRCGRACAVALARGGRVGVDLVDPGARVPTAGLLDLTTPGERAWLEALSGSAPPPEAPRSVGLPGGPAQGPGPGPGPGPGRGGTGALGTGRPEAPARAGQPHAAHGLARPRGRGRGARGGTDRGTGLVRRTLAEVARIIFSGQDILGLRLPKERFPARAPFAPNRTIWALCTRQASRDRLLAIPSSRSLSSSVNSRVVVLRVSLPLHP